MKAFRLPCWWIFAKDMFPGVRTEDKGVGRRTTASSCSRSTVASNCSELKLGLVGYLASRRRLKRQETILVRTASRVLCCGMLRPDVATSLTILVPIDLLIEVLGVGRAGGTGDAGDYRKYNQPGRTGWSS
jgi:hypothetical protein